MNFSEIVKNTLLDVIEENNFQVKVSRAFEKVELVNDRCIIRFICEMGFVECSLVDPVEKAKLDSMRKDGLPSNYPIYNLFQVLKFLYPNDSEDFRIGWKDVEIQIQLLKKQLTTRLANVINGDFGWTPAFKQNTSF